MSNHLGETNLENILQGVLKIQGRQLDSDELVKARIVKNQGMVLQLAKQYEDHDSKITSVLDRMSQYENNEEIEDEKVREIQARIKQRVTKVLDYPNGDSVLYYQTFISNIYAYLRHSHCLGSRTTTTKKKHYDTVMTGIETWYPNIQELKDRKDKRDRVRAGM